MNKNFIKEIYHLYEIDSTNRELKNDKYDIGSFLYADVQTAGYGRNNSKFISNNNDGLWCSFKIKLNIQKIKLLTQVIVISLRNTLIKYLKEKNIQFYDNIFDNITIKWPNDLYVNDKKISGILCESCFENLDLKYIIVGIGINLNNIYFDNSIKNIATSVYLEYNVKICKEIFIDYLIREINQNLDFLDENLNDKNNYFIDYLNKYTYLKGKRIEIIKNNYNLIGDFYKIDIEGNLVIKVNDDLVICNSNEVKIVDYF